MNETWNQTISPPSEWEPYLTFSVTLVLLALLAISAILNLGTICTIWCGSQPRRYGYFHLLILFCFCNVVYFLAKAFLWSLKSAHLLELLDRSDASDDVLAFVNDLPYQVTSQDFLTCVLGTSLLVLTAMTVDCLCANTVRSRPIRKCVRSFAGVTVLVVGVAILLGVLFVRGVFASLVDVRFAARDEIFLVSLVYLVSFALLPSFFLVIFGAVNWVTDRNSSRPIKAARMISRRLDRRICVLSSILLVLFLVLKIFEFSLDLKYEGVEEAHREPWMDFAVLVLALVVDFLFALYPMVFQCALGRFCCCAD